MKEKLRNTITVFTPLGASNHSNYERAEHDYYATEPKAIELLLKHEQFDNVWECACGEKHLANVLDQRGLLGRASDIVDRCNNEMLDFLSSDNTLWGGI